MVSPGTRLVKNHESLSITIESQFKKRSKLKCLDLYVTRQLIWRQARTLFITVLLKLKYSPSTYLKNQKD